MDSSSKSRKTAGLIKSRIKSLCPFGRLSFDMSAVRKILGKTCSIDKCTYTGGILSLSGWAFDDNKEITGMELIIKTAGETREITEGNFKIRRPDVFNVYNSRPALYSGFEFLVSVNTAESFDVILKFFKGKKKTEISCGSFKGEKTTEGNDKIISVIKSGVPVDIESVINSYTASEPCDFSEVYKRSYDIIIPVYNGFKYLDRLFETAVRTKAGFRLIIIEDKSPDERVLPYLRNIKDKYPDTELIVHDINKGFVESVNDGLRASSNDAVILNTDVELPDMWLERLMAPIVSDPSAASATPFTNSGTICSFPEFLSDNPIFMGRTPDEIDNAFRKIKPSYVSAPTGVGFCMAMSRAAIDKVGLLDSETFFKGYGEENDWCQRAVKSGFKNVIAENLFVYHNHGGSFSSEEKEELLKKNLALLTEKHPGYTEDIETYCAENPHKRLRDFVQMNLSNEFSSRSNLIFSHAWGGGAEIYIKNVKKKLLSKGEFIIDIKFQPDSGLYSAEVSCGNFKTSYTLKSLDILQKLNLKTDRIIINELAGYGSIYETLDFIINLRSKFKAGLIYLMHDYFALCPSVYLLRNNEYDCRAETNCEKCEKCLKTSRASVYPEYGEMSLWRKKWGNFLKVCDEVRFFSNSSKDLAEKVYGGLSNSTVVPHEVNYITGTGKKYKTTETLNIGIPAVLTKHKGLDIVKNMLKLTGSGDNIKIKVIGYAGEKITHENYSETGRYTCDELPRLTLENDIDVFFIPSIWEETFSFTAEEAMKTDIPVMTFDLGAPAERVRLYDKGFIIDEMSPEAALETARRIKLLPVKRAERILFTVEQKYLNSGFRVEQFREVLLTEGIASDFIMAEDIEEADIKKYGAVVICSAPYTKALDKLISSAKAAGKKVFFDVDGLYFDFDAVSHIGFTKNDMHRNFKKYTAGIRKCMELCDGYFAPSDSLGAEIKKAFPDKPVCINRNVLSFEALALSSRAAENKKTTDETVTLGYFSDSVSDAENIKVISNVLVEIMEKYDSVNLVLGGFADSSEADMRFKSFGGRVKCVDFCDRKKMPGLLASADIILMPLENNIFNGCRSEKKWLEASAAKVCTVGSYNEELAEIIKDGVGCLCKTEEEWREALTGLIEDGGLRRSLSEAAYNEVIEKHTVLTGGKKLTGAPPVEGLRPNCRDFLDIPK